jgi:hypothetical protein
MATAEVQDCLREKLRRKELNDAVVFDGVRVTLIRDM